MRRLSRASVWNDAQIDRADHKHRWKLRVWMPLYLATVVLAGIGVANHGSPVLDRTFPGEVVDALGFALIWFALVAYIGITFPDLWGVEIAGLIATSTMIGTHGAAMLFVAESPSSREFLSWLVLGGVVFVFDRLTTLGEEIKERRTGAT